MIFTRSVRLTSSCSEFLCVCLVCLLQMCTCTPCVSPSTCSDHVCDPAYVHGCTCAVSVSLCVCVCVCVYMCQEYKGRVSWRLEQRMPLLFSGYSGSKNQPWSRMWEIPPERGELVQLEGSGSQERLSGLWAGPFIPPHGISYPRTLFSSSPLCP